MAGFDCFFSAGSQMSAYLLGVPDTGIIGLRDMADHARHMASRCGVPVLLDGDTGFGNAVNVYFTVQEIINAGVASISLEDQEAPKKSGTSAGRRCISTQEMVGKLQAAAAARDALDPAFCIVARCDVLGAEGGSFEAAYERCMAYATDGRADVVWLNSAQTLEQLEKLCKEINIPFQNDMLSWEKGARIEDGVWASYWYKNIHNSTGFMKYKAKETPFPEYLKPLLAECLPYYEQLSQLAI